MSNLANRFSIEVVNKRPEIIDGLPFYTGEITIGDYKETFQMSINSWSLEDYKQQWGEGLARIKTHDKSCLVDYIHDIKIDPMIEMWVLFKVEDMVYVQQHMLSKKILEYRNSPLDIEAFSKENCYEFVRDRKVNKKGLAVSASGNRIYDEWKVSLSAFDQY